MRLRAFQSVDVHGVTLREVRSWCGRHLDFAINVVAHGAMVHRDAPIWCAYIYLYEPAFEPEQWAEWWDDAPEVREFLIWRNQVHHVLGPWCPTP